MRYWWLTKEHYEWCLQAEKELLEKLPEIIERANRTTQQWRNEKEHIEQWKLCDW